MRKFHIFLRSFTFGLLFFLVYITQINVCSLNPFIISAQATDLSTISDPQLNVYKKSLVKESTYTLKVYNLEDGQKASFKSSDSGIASIDEDGTIHANKIGNATITVSIKEGFKSSSNLYCEITVGPPAISVRFTKSKVEVTVGKKTALKITLKPITTAEEAVYTSSDPKIATVTSTGKVTGKSPGVAYIYATIGDNKSDSCQVTVIEQEPVSLSRSSVLKSK